MESLEHVGRSIWKEDVALVAEGGPCLSMMAGRASIAGRSRENQVRGKQMSAFGKRKIARSPALQQIGAVGIHFDAEGC